MRRGHLVGDAASSYKGSIFVRFGRIGAAVLAALITTTGAVFARPDVHLTTHGYVVHVSAAGTKLEEFSAAVAPHRGDLIEWKVDVVNQGADAAHKVVTVLPVAVGTVFKSGTASQTASVTVEYSIDHGATFSALPVRVVRSSSGLISKPVDPSEYTTVRWVLNGDLAAGKGTSLSYEAVVK